jgi:hypothetical protein
MGKLRYNKRQQLPKELQGEGTARPCRSQRPLLLLWIPAEALLVDTGATLPATQSTQQQDMSRHAANNSRSCSSSGMRLWS